MAKYPMDVIASDNIWKLTLPLPGAPEILQPKLATYNSEWFHLNEAGNGVVFFAPVTGGTTQNSKYPRSELREMKDAGKNKASWSCASGQHSMIVDLMVTALPDRKPHAVVAQIHGGEGEDDLTVWRLEGRNLWITDGDDPHGHLVSNSYALGTRIQVGFHVKDGVISYSYNGKPVDYTMDSDEDGCYFKTGCYAQANSSNGSGHAQTVLYSVQVCHNGVCHGNAPGVIIVPGEPPVEPPTTPDLAELRQQMNGLTLRIAATEQDLARLRAGLGAAALEK